MSEKTPSRVLNPGGAAAGLVSPSSRHSDTLGLIRSHTRAREELRDSHGVVPSHEADTDRERLERTAAHVQSSLTDREVKVSAAERSLAQHSAVCTRAVNRAEERTALAQDTLRRAQAEKERQAVLLAAVSEELVASRREISKLQVAAEEERRGVEELRRERSAAQHEAQARQAQQAAAREQARAEEQALQAELSGLEGRLQSLYATHTALNERSVQERAAHATQVEGLRAEAAAVRREQAEAQSVVSQLRRAIQEATALDEAASRRALKDAADLEEEHRLERLVATRGLTERHDETVRERKAAFEKEHEAMRGSAGQLREEREEAERRRHALTAANSALQGRVKAAQLRMDQLAAMRRREVAAGEDEHLLEQDLDGTTEVASALRDQLADVEERVSTLRDTVAPLRDVEASVAALRRGIEEQRTALGDTQTQRAVSSAGRHESLKNTDMKRVAAERRVNDARALAAESSDDAARAREEIESQLRVLGVETGTIEDNIRSLTSRNQTLTAALEEIERQRAALEATIARQRDEAKRAAASLLMQLEGK